MANQVSRPEKARTPSATSREVRPKKCLRACRTSWRCRVFVSIILVISTVPAVMTSTPWAAILMMVSASPSGLTSFLKHSKLTQLFQMFVGLSPSSDDELFDLTLVDPSFDFEETILAPILAPGIGSRLENKSCFIFEFFKDYFLCSPDPNGRKCVV